MTHGKVLSRALASALLFVESLPLALIVFGCFGRQRARPLLAFGLLAVLVLALPAQAQVHKCINAAGRVEYREAPCASDARAGGQINVQANTSDGQAVERARLAMEDDRLRERLQRVEAGQLQDNRAQANVPSAANSSACQTATRSYQVGASSIAPNKADIASRRSAMHAACGTIEPSITEVTVIKRPPPIQRECMDARDWDCVQKFPRR